MLAMAGVTVPCAPGLLELGAQRPEAHDGGDAAATVRGPIVRKSDLENLLIAA